MIDYLIEKISSKKIEDYKNMKINFLKLMLIKNEKALKIF